MNHLIQNIHEHVSKDNLCQAVDLLFEYCKLESSIDLTEVLLLSRQLYSINKAMRTGIIEWKEGNQLRNKVALHILQLLRGRFTA